MLTKSVRLVLLLLVSTAVMVVIIAPGCLNRPPAVYLALGDSYTIGQSVNEADRWPVQLLAALKQRGVDLGDPQIIAQTGWTTADLLSAMDHAPLRSRYQWVTLMIGVNDQYQGVPVEVFRVRLNQLLDRATKLAGDPKHVVVISIPDWSVTPFSAGRDRAAIAKDIDRFNSAYAEEVAKRQIAFVDVTSISRQAADDASLIAGDGLHPSAKMYSKWVDFILEKMAPSKVD